MQCRRGSIVHVKDCSQSLAGVTYFQPLPEFYIVVFGMFVSLPDCMYVPIDSA
jgi:hypothetical protein